MSALQKVVSSSMVNFFSPSFTQFFNSDKVGAGMGSEGSHETASSTSTVYIENMMGVQECKYIKSILANLSTSVPFNVFSF